LFDDGYLTLIGRRKITRKKIMNDDQIFNLTNERTKKDRKM